MLLSTILSNDPDALFIFHGSLYYKHLDGSIKWDEVESRIILIRHLYDEGESPQINATCGRAPGISAHRHLTFFTANPIIETFTVKTSARRLSYLARDGVPMFVSDW